MLAAIVLVFSPPMPHPQPFPDAEKGALFRGILRKPKQRASFGKQPYRLAEVLPLFNWRGAGGEAEHLLNSLNLWRIYKFPGLQMDGISGEPTCRKGDLQIVAAGFGIQVDDLSGEK